MLTSGWIAATFGDGTKLSTEIDLGNHYNRVLIIMPAALDGADASATVTVCNVSGGTFRALHNIYLNTPADVTALVAKATVVDIAGARYLKLAAPTTDQTTTSTAYIIGVPW